jgi:hypothetical protein
MPVIDLDAEPRTAPRRTRRPHARFLAVLAVGAVLLNIPGEPRARAIPCDWAPATAQRTIIIDPANGVILQIVECDAARLRAVPAGR